MKEIDYLKAALEDTIGWRDLSADNFANFDLSGRNLNIREGQNER